MWELLGPAEKGMWGLGVGLGIGLGGLGMSW
jgi:hypothetical protein